MELENGETFIKFYIFSKNSLNFIQNKKINIKISKIKHLIINNIKNIYIITLFKIINNSNK